MTTLIIKREILESWKSLKTIIHCRSKMVAMILKFYWKRKGFEVEELEE